MREHSVVILCVVILRYARDDNAILRVTVTLVQVTVSGEFFIEHFQHWTNYLTKNRV